MHVRFGLCDVIWTGRAPHRTDSIGHVQDAAKSAMAGRGGNVEAWEGPRILRALQGGKEVGVCVVCCGLWSVDWVFGGLDMISYLQTHTTPRQQEDDVDDEETMEEAVSQLLGHVLEQAENFSGVRRVLCRR